MPDSQIFWMVRNEGREAENINDLGHIAGRGLRHFLAGYQSKNFRGARLSPPLLGMHSVEGCAG